MPVLPVQSVRLLAPLFRRGMFFLGRLLPLVVSAAVESWVVTPGSMQEWAVAGAERQVVQAASALADISLSFAAGAVLVRVVGTPRWAEAAAEWPILQVGEALDAAHTTGDRLFFPA
ncbi:MAG TPA: hypothetical protein PLQ52_01030 [Lacunisphaera sp.]|nr:hypothetical protein [Lacunisphaera sp.]